MKLLAYLSFTLMLVFSQHLIYAQSQTNFMEKIEKGLLGTFVYSLIGMIIMTIVFKVIDILTPGHLSKQIVEDRNIAMAIVIAGAMIGVSIIIAASIV